MAIQTVFKRYEIKYMITLEQKAKILEAMKPYMKLDKYGRTTIRNIYYDTDTYLLIRRSIEKPTYKEKLRIAVVKHEYGKELIAAVDPDKEYQAVIACVSHNQFKTFDFKKYKDQGAVIFDVKDFVDRALVDGRL